MSTAEVIDPPTSGDRVTFGSTVRVEDQDGKETLYQIVGSEETDPTRGRISVMAPLARTLIGKKVGDTVEAQLPGGKKTLRDPRSKLPLAFVARAAPERPRADKAAGGARGLSPLDTLTRHP